MNVPGSDGYFPRTRADLNPILLPPQHHPTLPASPSDRGNCLNSSPPPDAALLRPDGLSRQIVTQEDPVIISKSDCRRKEEPLQIKAPVYH